MNKNELETQRNILQITWNELYEEAKIATTDIKEITPIKSAQRCGIYLAMEIIEKHIKNIDLDLDRLNC